VRAVVSRRRRVNGGAVPATACTVLLFFLATTSTPVLAHSHADHQTAALDLGHLRADEITVFHRAGEERPAARILEVASGRADAVAAAAGLESMGPVVIFVASTNAHFRTLTHDGVPDWGAGCAFPDRGLIVLKNPVTAPDPLHMEDVVVHEMAHVAAGRVLGEVQVPRWFHEGIAMSIAGEWRLPRSSMMAAAGASGGLIPLSELRGAFPEGGTAAMLAYTESFYAMRYLMSEAGDATPAQLLAAVADAGSFDGAVSSLTGRGLAEFESDAVSSFRRRFGWGVLLTRWNVGFGILALVLVVGGALRLRRSRVRLREMAEEEAGGPTRWERGEGRDARWS